MILAIDYGIKRVGLAIGVNGVVSPYAVLQNNFDIVGLAVEIGRICNEQKVTAIVLGLPEGKNAASRDLIKEIKKLSKILEKDLKIKVQFVDESYSSSESQMLLVKYGFGKKHRRENVDSAAAAVILARYFEDAGI